MRIAPMVALTLVFSTFTGFAAADEAIPVDVLNHIKANTVFLKVRTGRLEVSGTGFLVQVDKDTSLIVTNEHVVVTPKDLRLPPVQITAVFNSGRKNELSFPVEIVAADELSDLAILRIKNPKDLPKPLDLSQKAELTETMPIYMFGFPFGQALSTNKGHPNITIGKGSVSSLRENDRGQISVIQIDGDINAGNSGGPVVDKAGRLIGIAVAKVRGTNIGMAVPAGQLADMFNGRISSLSQRVVKVEDGVAEVEVMVKFIDPLKKFTKVSVLVSPSETVRGLLKPDASGKFAPMPNAQTVDLVVENQIATGKVILKSNVKVLRSYNFQAAYMKDGKSLTYTDASAAHSVNFGPKSVAIKRPDTPPIKINPGDPPPVSLNGGKIRSVTVGNGQAPACMCWSDDGKAFFHLDGTGVVRRFSYPEMVEVAKNAIGRKCSWISMSSLGLVATVCDAQEAWVLDPKTLQEGKKIDIGKSQFVVSSPRIAFAYAINADPTKPTLSVLDLKAGKVARQYKGDELDRQGDGCFETPIMSPDGKKIFATGGTELMYRLDVDGLKVAVGDVTERLISGAFEGLCVSDNSEFVCAPSGGGNHAASKYSTFIFSTANLKKPILTISSGAHPKAVGFDTRTGLIYTQNNKFNLLVFNNKGLIQKQLSFDETGNEPFETHQFLVHPDGNRLVALTHSDAGTAEPHSRLFAVDLTEGGSISTPNDPKQVPAPKTEPAKPLTEAKIPEGWNEALPKFCTYGVYFPPNGRLTENESSILLPRAAGQMRVFRAIFDRKDGSLFAVSQMNLPPTLLKSGIDARQALLRDVALAEFNGKLVSESAIEMAGMNGKEYMIQSGEKFFRFRLIGPGVQIYRIVVAGTEEQVNSKDAEAFFDSFKRMSKMNTK